MPGSLPSSSDPRTEAEKYKASVEEDEEEDEEEEDETEEEYTSGSHSQQIEDDEFLNSGEMDFSEDPYL